MTPLTHLDQTNTVQILLLSTVTQVPHGLQVVHQSIARLAEVGHQTWFVLHLPLLVREERAPVQSEHAQSGLQVEQEGEIALEPLLVMDKTIAHTFKGVFVL